MKLVSLLMSVLFSFCCLAQETSNPSVAPVPAAATPHVTTGTTPAQVRKGILYWSAGSFWDLPYPI